MFFSVCTSFIECYTKRPYPLSANQTLAKQNNPKNNVLLGALLPKQAGTFVAGNQHPTNTNKSWRLGDVTKEEHILRKRPECLHSFMI